MFWALFIIGLALRGYQLDTQILWDDEWHSIFNVRDYSFWDNATHFRESDNCIPLTLFHQIFKETTGLNEFGLRLLPFLAGLLTIFFCYWAVKRILDKKTSLIFTALVIISPLLVYFSRYARPYSIAALLSFIAVLAFYEWAKTEKSFMLAHISLWRF